jgi:hypothetical protein
MNLYRSLTRSTALSLDEWASWFSMWGNQGLIGLNQTLTGKTEEITPEFPSLVQGAYQRNGVVFACELARIMLFSEARFQFQQMRFGTPGDLFGTAALEILEEPWPGATTGDLLTRALLDADFAGNHFATVRRGRIVRMRPDWVTIVLGSFTGNVEAFDLDTELVGYLYHPGGRHSGKDPVPLGASAVAHFAPIPDPMASYRGMSWLSPVITEIMGDQAASTHKLKFFENGATPNMVVQLNEDIQPEAFQKWIEIFEGRHPPGMLNAYKTLYLGGGADAKVIGADMRQIDFKQTQGAGETRIAAAAGVPPVIVGLSEGLQAATYSNYGQARRRFADLTARPLWRNVCGSYAKLVRVPGRARLWYDDAGIPFLAEDQKDNAEIQQTQANAIKQLVDAGFEAESVIDAITSGDMTRLEHTHLFSVQLQPANSNGQVSVEDEAGRALAKFLVKYLPDTHALAP